MKVLLTKQFSGQDLQFIKSLLNDHIELITPPEFTEESFVENASGIDVLFGSFISENLLKAATSLKFLQIPWTGVDNLDFGLLKKYNVTVCNSHSNAIAVAEHAVALMFDAAKKLSYHDRLLRKGEWNRPDSKLNEISPFSRLVSRSNVGIIGFGAIGQKICRLLTGYSCSFQVFTKNISLIEKDFQNIELHQPDAIAEYLHDLDIIFISVPLTNETKGMLGKSFFQSMKPDSILVNISRGDVIVDEDFYHALKNKEIGFAAVDTWYNYPSNQTPITFPSKKFNFHDLNNLVLSPHRAGYIEGRFPHLDDAIENLNRFFKGESLINVISLENNY